MQENNAYLHMQSQMSCEMCSDNQSEYMSQQIPPTKKQKTSATTKRIFVDYRDEREYKSICYAISQSDDAKTLHLINDVIQTIAKYATGKVETCHSKKCSNEILILHHDCINYNFNTKYLKCDYSQRIYCNQCKDLVEPRRNPREHYLCRSNFGVEVCDCCSQKLIPSEYEFHRQECGNECVVIMNEDLCLKENKDMCKCCQMDECPVCLAKNCDALWMMQDLGACYGCYSKIITQFHIN